MDLTPTIVKGMGLLKSEYPSDPTGLHTILVGGLGKGGRGYFALDISDPFTMTNATAVVPFPLGGFECNPTVDTDDMSFDGVKSLYR